MWLCFVSWVSTSSLLPPLLSISVKAICKKVSMWIKRCSVCLLCFHLRQLCSIVLSTHQDTHLRESQCRALMVHEWQAAQSALVVTAYQRIMLVLLNWVRSFISNTAKYYLLIFLIIKWLIWNCTPWSTEINISINRNFVSGFQIIDFNVETGGNSNNSNNNEYWLHRNEVSIDW